MSKIRVYEIAKELNFESKALVTKLQGMGYDVKSHASSLEIDQANEIISRLQAEQRANVVEQRISTGVIRRRTKAVPAPLVVEDSALVTEGEAVASLASSQDAPAVEEAREGFESAPIQGADALQPEPQEPEAAAPVGPKAKETPRPAKPEEKPYLYRATVIRRAAFPPAEPVDPAHAGARPAVAAKPTGIRVLKVVPGKEGRGHEFIDMSKKEKTGRPKTTEARFQKADLKEQLFDAFSPAYVPGLGRRRRMAKKAGRKTAVTTPRALKRVIKIESDRINSSELAKRMGIKLREVINKLRDMGETIEDTREDRILDMSTATLLAKEFEYEIQDISFKEESILENRPDSPEELLVKPPVVTVMGHVDHGKTSILDAIRKANVAAGEEGGITQHIGAYEVQLAQGSITFIDTPGHEAFTAMRARGASITDIVVLVVAADDGIMPQTIEAIHHAQEAKVPIVVAVNKVDLPGVQPDRIKQALTEYQLVSEEWGGDTMILPVSAKTKAGLAELLDALLLQAEVLELRSNPQRPASGNIIEARLDRGRGPVATLLVRDGSLHKGDTVVVGTSFGRVRMMFDAEGNTIDTATPGRPVQVQGLAEVPKAGEPFNVVESEREAKKIVDHRLEEINLARSGQTARMNLEDFYERLQGNEKKELKVLVKADVQGTAEAVRQAVEKLATPKVGVKVIHHGVGAISETDVNLASASNAIMVGFNTRPDTNAKKLATTIGVDIRTYKIIYDLTEDVRKAQAGLLPTTTKEQVLGRAEVRELFNIPKVGTIAGVSVLEGKMLRGSHVRLLRDNVEVHHGRMSSLKRLKEDVREVASGYECGIGIENYNDIKRGDIIEAFTLEEQQATL